MKTNKVTKLGVSLLSVAALGVVAPALTDVPVFGVSIVKADENQEPLKYRITYYDIETRERLGQMTGVINPGQTINIYKKFNGHEIISKDEWMPNYDMTYDIVNEYFYGSSDGYNDLRLEYKKVEEPTPTPTPEPEAKPETKPSDTPKPEVKPEPAPKEEEKQEPLKYRIDYLDADTGEEISREYGVLNPGETINIYKDIEGYEVVSKYSWMPGYKVDYRIMNTYFGGTLDENYMFLRYKKVNTDAKPSDTPKPEVKPETKPSETPKPEVKPETKPSETPKPEVKPETKPSDTPKPEVKPEPKPSDTSKPEVKPEPKPSDTPKPEVKPAPKPSETPKPEVKPEPKPSDASKPEVKPSEKPVAEAEEQQKPLKYRIDYLEKGSGGKKVAASEFGVLNPGETVNIYKDIEGFEVVSHYEWLPGYNMDYDTLSTYSGSVDGYNYMYLFYKKVKPAPKPSDTSKPEVKPEPKPSETPKPEVKPEPKPSETPKPEVKPETKPSETPKPEVKPEPKPSDTSKPEVKPELKPQTNSNTAPTAPVKPVGQTSNSKADKPTSKKETPALPNTGEQSSSLSLFGLLLASIGLAGLTYKGRH